MTMGFKNKRVEDIAEALKGAKKKVQLYIDADDELRKNEHPMAWIALQLILDMEAELRTRNIDPTEPRFGPATMKMLGN